MTGTARALEATILSSCESLAPAHSGVGCAGGKDLPFPSLSPSTVVKLPGCPAQRVLDGPPDRRSPQGPNTTSPCSFAGLQKGQQYLHVGPAYRQCDTFVREGVLSRGLASLRKSTAFEGGLCELLRGNQKAADNAGRP